MGGPEFIPLEPGNGADSDLPAAGTLPPPPAQLALTVRQVADMLGMSAKAVYHRAERGQLPGKFYVGRSLRFRRVDLMRLVAEGRTPSLPRER